MRWKQSGEVPFDLVEDGSVVGKSVAAKEVGGELSLVAVEEPEMYVDPLDVCCPVEGRYENQRSKGASGWVLDMVSTFKHMVGVSCEGYKDDLMSLFAALERDRGQCSLKTPCKKGGKLEREFEGFRVFY